jgi:hypothetical protein
LTHLSLDHTLCSRKQASVTRWTEKHTAVLFGFEQMPGWNTSGLTPSPCSSGRGVRSPHRREARLGSRPECPSSRRRCRRGLAGRIRRRAALTEPADWRIATIAIRPLLNTTTTTRTHARWAMKDGRTV